MPPYDSGTGQGTLERLVNRLADEAADALSAISRTRRFGADDIVFMEGDQAEYVCCIADGVVRAVRLLADGRRQITGFLFPGDFLGVNFNRSDVYGYGAEAVTDVTVTAYARRPLNRLIDGDPKVRRLFLTEMSHELTAAQDRMLFLARRSAEQRVAAFLLHLADRQNSRLPGEGDRAEILTIPMRWSDIADYLGLTPETVSRSMASFRRGGVIATVGRTALRVEDWNGLLARASGQM